MEIKQCGKQFFSYRFFWYRYT